MRWTLLPALAGAFGLAATAVQADDSTMDWSGFYAGLSAGGASVNGDFLGYPGMHGPWEPWSGGDDKGLAGGVQAGFNHQVDSLVLGLEGQFLLTDIGATAVNAHGRPPTSYDANWLINFGPRIGYASGNALLYAKAGVALADLDYNHNSYTGSSTAYGFALGAGAEYAISPSLSGRLDYTYYGFSGEKTTLYDSGGTARTMVDHEPDAHVLSVGLNLHF